MDMVSFTNSKQQGSSLLKTFFHVHAAVRPLVSLPLAIQIVKTETHYLERPKWRNFILNLETFPL